MAGLLVGLRVDRVPVGVLAVGDEALGAVDDPLVALLGGGRLHPRDVGAGVGLGEAEAGELRRLGEHAQVLLLDLVAAAEGDRRRGEAVGGERGADAGAAPSELLLDQTARQVVEARAAVLLGRVGVHQADLPGLLDDLLGPGAFLVELPGDLAHLLLGEVVRHLPQVLLLVGKCEVNHRGSLLVSRGQGRRLAPRNRLTSQSTSWKDSRFAASRPLLSAPSISALISPPRCSPAKATRPPRSRSSASDASGASTE